MKKQRDYTNYLFGDVMPADELREKLETLGFKTWSDQNNELLAAFPANAGSSWDGVHISKGERDDYGESEPYVVIEISLLHPNPEHFSQYWEKMDEVLAIFRGIKRIARWNWRINALRTKKREQARKAKLLKKGAFHVIRFSWDDREDRTVLCTDDPSEAYNAYAALMEVYSDSDCRCRIICYLIKADDIIEKHLWRNQILRSYPNEPSSFEEQFIIAPHTRCGEHYYERGYANARRRYYNLLTGRSWVICPAMKIPSAPKISKEEKEFFKADKFPAYPIQPTVCG